MNPLNLTSIPIWATSLRTSIAQPPSGNSDDDKPETSEDDGLATSAAGSSRDTSDPEPDPEPARIVSDISRAPPARPFLTPDARAPKHAEDSDRVPSAPATTAAHHASRKEGHSFAKSSRMRALQSHWEQASQKKSLSGQSASSAITRELHRIAGSSASEGSRSADRQTAGASNHELIIDDSGRAQLSSTGGTASTQKRPRSHEESPQSNKRRVLPASTDDNSASLSLRPSPKSKSHSTAGKQPQRDQSNSNGDPRSPSASGGSPASNSLIPEHSLQQQSPRPRGPSNDKSSRFTQIRRQHRQPKHPADSSGSASYDDESSSDSEVSDIENKNAQPADVPAIVQDSKPHWETPLTRATDGRFYSQWVEDGLVKPTWGGVLPSNYAIRDDPECPYICPIRDCRTLLMSLQGLGGHMNAKHPRKTYNDNLDGTMTFLGDYKNPSGFSPPVIISRKPPSPTEPGPVEPAMSYKVRKMIEQQRTQQLADNLVTPALPPVLPKSSGESSINENTGQSRSRPVLKRAASSKAGNAEPTGSIEHLRQRLSRHIQMPETDFVKGLLQLPRKRDLPASCSTKKRLVDNLTASVLHALLLYVTGDAVAKCFSCQNSANALGECVVWPGDATTNSRAATCGCANCWLDSSLYHRKNECPYIEGLPPKPSEDHASLTNGTSPSSPNPRGPIMVATSTSERAGLAANANGGSIGSIRSGPVSQGLGTVNALPSNILEMEDWEVAPGRLRDESASAPENIAFSNSYLTSNQAIRISGDVSFNVVTLKPGSSTNWDREEANMRICSVAMGKLRIKMDDTEFVIGPNGMFKIRPGVACSAQNRLYIDAVVHVTTVAEY